MRLAWITDPHFDHCRYYWAFGESLKGQYDGYLLTGDIAEAHTLAHLLKVFTKEVSAPVYFVLGNHDIYRDSIWGTRAKCALLAEEVDDLHWLGGGEVVELSNTTALVGHGGWYDARSGDPEGSRVVMTDFRLIRDFQRLSHGEIINKCREVASIMRGEAEPVLRKAAERYEHVFFATHFPPYREACWHQGSISDRNWLPWFTNLTFGAMLTQTSEDFPKTNFTVLCGHTHSAGQVSIRENLRVITGSAEYGKPAINATFDV